MELAANDNVCNRSAEDPQGRQTGAEVWRERNGRLHRMGSIGERTGRARSRGQSQAHEDIEHIVENGVGVCENEKFATGSAKSLKGDENRVYRPWV